MTPMTTARDRIRGEILDAASFLFAEQGYAGTSMRDLARRTNRSLASFYLYFASKEDLLFAVHARAFESLIESAEAAIAASTEPSARLHAFILNHVRYLAERPETMRVLIHEVGVLAPKHRRALRGFKERYFALGRALIAALGAEVATPDPVELERCTYAVFGMINWAWSWYDVERHGPPERVAETLHRIAVHGLASGLVPSFEGRGITPVWPLVPFAGASPHVGREAMR